MPPYQQQNPVLPMIIVIGLIFVVFVVPFFFIVTIGAGEVGVKYSLMGGVSEDQLGEGLFFKMPWEFYTKYNVKTQDYTMSIIEEEGVIHRADEISAITKDGLTIDLDITVLYKIDPAKAYYIHKTIGPNYQSIIIRPQIRSIIREVVSEFNAEEVYGEQRKAVEEGISTRLNLKLDVKDIILEDVLLRNVALPTLLKQSIEAKLTAQQDAFKMEYVLQKAEKEAQRKVIEANGTAMAIEIVRQQLQNQSESYLYYLYIQALSESRNVIYVPTEGGLPLFKNVD
jgi:regulator of protease activity HflC (stomatin/prohibitin superfamily)